MRAPAGPTGPTSTSAPPTDHDRARPCGRRSPRPARRRPAGHHDRLTTTGPGEAGADRARRRGHRPGPATRAPAGPTGPTSTSAPPTDHDRLGEAGAGRHDRPDVDQLATTTG